MLSANAQHTASAIFTTGIAAGTPNDAAITPAIASISPCFCASFARYTRFAASRSANRRFTVPARLSWSLFFPQSTYSTWHCSPSFFSLLVKHGNFHRIYSDESILSTKLSSFPHSAMPNPLCSSRFDARNDTSVSPCDSACPSGRTSPKIPIFITF